LKGYDCKTDSHIPYKTIIEDWDVKEKLSKFIFNSSFVFNYLGHQHYFPLWDTQLVKHFSTLAYKYREDKMLYDETLIKYYFNPLNVYFETDELSVSCTKRKIQRFKDNLRQFVPWKIVYKRMLKTDWIYYSAFCSELEKEMISKGQPKIKNYKYFNAVISKYYLFKLGFYNKD
jgi:asparagine synthase (glutamine-hydrolysing)